CASCRQSKGTGRRPLLLFETRSGERLLSIGAWGRRRRSGGAPRRSRGSTFVRVLRRSASAYDAQTAHRTFRSLDDVRTGTAGGGRTADGVSARRELCVYIQ